MTASAWPVLIYAALVAVFLALPYLAQTAPSARRAEHEDLGFAALLISGGGLLAFPRGWELVEVPLILLLSALGTKWRPLAGAAAALLFLPATWWMAKFDYSLVHRLGIAAFCLVVALLARQATFSAPRQGKCALCRRGELALVGTLLALGLGAGLLTGAANDNRTLWELWHHWGAYMSPVSAMLAGGVPYRDFPVQYGMGPTMLIAASCPLGCWTGIYVLTIVANALQMAVLGWSLLLLTRRRDTASRLLALGALFCCSYIWTGLPSDWGGAIISPSVAGMRFVPLALLLGLILTAEHDPQASATLPRWITITGHGLWLLGLAWSPESAFFASLVWWPWLALRRADAGQAGRPAWMCLARGGVIGLAAVLAGYAGLALLFRLVFGEWAGLSDYLLYMQHPPGLLPVNAKGLIWFVAALLMLAARALLGQEHGAQWRALYACVVAALAALSYYLSRSHDNNLLNLLPFLLLVLVATRELLPTQFVTGFVRAALVAMIAFTATIHYHPWTVQPGANSIAGLQLGSQALTARFSPSLSRPNGITSAEVAAAFDDLHARGARSIVLFDERIVMPLGEPQSDWTGVNSLANFIPLPGADIERYIQRGAVTYHRPGWIVINRKNYSQWLGLFQTAYGVTEERRYGGYSAYHLVPRDAH